MRGLRSTGPNGDMDRGAVPGAHDAPDSTGLLILVGSLVAFILSAALSTWASGYPLQSMIRGAWTPLILAIVLLYGLYAAHLRAWVRPALTVLLVLLCAGSLWQAHTGWHLEGGRLWRAHGFLPHPNDTALAAIMAPLLAPWTWPFAAGLILLSGSRTALVGLAVALLMLTRSWRLRACVLAGAGISLVAFVHASFVISATSRMGAWVVAWRMFREHPLLGMGPQTFVDHYLAWLPSTLPFGIAPDVDFIPWAHNLYLEVLAERGLLGFAVMAVGLTLAWWYATRPVRAAMAAILVMGLLDLTFLKPWVVAAVWGVVTLSLTPPLPSTGIRLFRVCDWPSGWTHREQRGVMPNGVGIRCRVWTYFLTWGHGPYLTG